MRGRQRHGLSGESSGGFLSLGYFERGSFLSYNGLRLGWG